MQKINGLVAAVAVLGFVAVAGAIPITVSSVGEYAPNPNGLTITDAASNLLPGGATLASFQTKVSSAFAAGTGGVLNGEAATGWGLNTTYGDSALNPISATYGATQTSTLQFWRTDLSLGAPVGLNANNNNGTNVVSGTNYIGIQGSAGAINLVLATGLSDFGITFVPRGAPRTLTVTAILDDLSTIASSIESTNSTNAVFFGFTAPAGRTITGLNFAEPTFAFFRLDDFGFVTAAIPEPTSVGLLGAVGMAMVARRRR